MHVLLVCTHENTQRSEEGFGCSFSPVTLYLTPSRKGLSLNLKLSFVLLARLAANKLQQSPCLHPWSWGYRGMCLLFIRVLSMPSPLSHLPSLPGYLPGPGNSRQITSHASAPTGEIHPAFLTDCPSTLHLGPLSREPGAALTSEPFWESLRLLVCFRSQSSQACSRSPQALFSLIATAHTIQPAASLPRLPPSNFFSVWPHAELSLSDSYSTGQLLFALLAKLYH